MMKSSLIDEVKEADRLGISYGTYMGYKETGYLNTFINNRKEEPTGNIIESNIVGASGRGTRANRQDMKIG